jgi:hypothetical protein
LIVSVVAQAGTRHRSRDLDRASDQKCRLSEAITDDGRRMVVTEAIE